MLPGIQPCPRFTIFFFPGAGKERPAGAEGLRFIRSCTASLPAEMMDQMERVFGVPVLEAYEMTEASHQPNCPEQVAGEFSLHREVLGLVIAANELLVAIHARQVSRSGQNLH
jgi:acyl-CoA synthetase (AMP-forming)/AMP-acid ligase II